MVSKTDSSGAGPGVGPPVKKSDAEHFTKQIEIKATDDQERLATGAVLVPDEVDRQGDFFSAATIHAVEAGYRRALDDGQVDQGVMHVAFPTDGISVERSWILSEDTEIGGEELPADTWLIQFHVPDDEIWSLVDDEILAGFSMGGWITDFSLWGVGELDPAIAATIPDSYEDDVVGEIHTAWIEEVSLVDIPAVPRAEVYESKADLEKAGEALKDPEKCVEVMRQRGHSEEEAIRLCRVTTETMQANDPDAGAKGADLEDLDPSMAEKAVNGFIKWLSGGGNPGSEAEKGAENGPDSALKAMYDASQTLLNDQLDGFETDRFSDKSGDPFDLETFGADRGLKSADRGGENYDTEASKALLDAFTQGVEAEKTDANTDPTMDDELDKRLSSIEETLKGLQESGEGSEEGEGTEKSNGGEGGEGGEDGGLDPEVDKRLSAIEETVEAINTQGGSGESQQKAGAQGAGEGEEPSQKAQLFMGAN